jgi:molybdate/tungstate transport system substrate-binding protein
MRPKETDLLALLEAGVIDYLFIYRSVAVQHGLQFLELPPEVNLADPERADYYGRVSVVQRADRPGGSARVAASPIVYGVTIPTAAPHPEAARRFVEMLLSQTGRRMMAEAGQEPLRPALLSPLSGTDAAPLPLEKLKP